MPSRLIQRWAAATRCVIALSVATRIAATATAGVIPKQIAAPPEDVHAGVVSWPSPADAGVRSTSAMLPIRLKAIDGVASWRAQIPIADASFVRGAVIAPDASDWRLSLTPPDRPTQTLRAGLQRNDLWVESIGLGLVAPAAAAPAFTLTNAPAGSWMFEITTNAQADVDRSTHGYLVLESDERHALHTHLTTYDLLVGRPVGLLASMQTGDPGIKRASIERAHVELTTPTGDVVRTPMRWTDKGWRHEFEPTEPGRHTARVTVLGRRDDGASLVRTTQHVLQILPDQLALGNEARIEPDTPGVWRVSIPLARADRDAPVIVSAEIWATPRDGDARCVCWLSRMASPSEPDATLFLDERWLARAGEFDQLELRNVRVQCCDSAIPLDRAPRMQIAGDDRIAIARRAPESITRDMLIGRPRAELVLPNRASDASRQARAFAGHNLMLVHGYCSSLVWPSGDFSGSVEVFADPSQNRSHDEFANLLLAFGNNSKSFGIVAHSQGGAAALHLWTYYFSGLDWAEGPRLIQSVGTPYQGTPLAGNLAILGDIFGTGCGANFDLSTDGAAMWLAGIPTASRAAVSYWTTSADGAACNFFSGLFLSDPEDGVVEVSRGQLAGANNMGNLEGWCHSTSMSDPPHYTDPSRNAEMNAEAAR